MKEGNSNLWDFLGKMLISIPLWLRVILILVCIIIGSVLVYNKWFPDIKCQEVVIIGICKDRNTMNTLSDYDVYIENANSDITDYTKYDGSFKLEGVKIPDSQIITLVIANGEKVYYIEQINLNNKMKYPITNCQLDLHWLYLSKEVSGENADDQDSFGKLQTYFNCNIYNDKIVQEITKKTQYKYDQNNADKFIEFTTTGSIDKQPYSNNLFVYTGGKLEIRINGTKCFVVDEAEVMASIKSGNSYEATKLHIDQCIDSLIITYSNIIVKNIIECLKN